jgi:phasin family protein
MPDDAKTARRSQSLPLSTPWNFNVDAASVTSRRAFEAWARGMSRLFQDMAEFMRTRLREDAAMWEKLAACRDPNAALDLQRQFTAKASADYTAASRKFARLMMEIGQSCGAGLRQSPPETD